MSLYVKSYFQDKRCEHGFHIHMADCADIDECGLGINFCGGLHCLNTKGSYFCGCRAGFIRSTDGEKSCDDIDECLLPTSCPVSSKCNNFPGYHNCTCHDGFGDDSCSDINECLVPNNCDENANCVNTEGTYNCHCKTGFVGSGQVADCNCDKGYRRDESGNCIDDNECSSNNHNCDRNAKCLNNDGSYSCNCLDGYYGPGETCARGNCKDSVCPENQECISRHSIGCQCKIGFKSVNDSCIDIDECLDEANICDKNAECSNEKGKYTCSCKQGFVGSGHYCEKGRCDDKICPQVKKKVCLSPTSSLCGCIEGFEKTNNSCVDIDECSLEVCPEASQCENNLGSYECSCLSGFEGAECTNIDECGTEERKCGISAYCVDSIGSFECQCPTGFAMNKTGDCEDINECVKLDSPCPKNVICINTDRSYYCDCPTGFKGSNCTNINECLILSDRCQNCVDTAGSYKCGSCKNGFVESENSICIDVDECTLGTHSCQFPLGCENLEGTYACQEEKFTTNSYYRA